MMLTFLICHMIGISSACTNPVLYGFLNDNFVKVVFQLKFSVGLDFTQLCICRNLILYVQHWVDSWIAQIKIPTIWRLRWETLFRQICFFNMHFLQFKFKTPFTKLLFQFSNFFRDTRLHPQLTRLDPKVDIFTVCPKKNWQLLIWKQPTTVSFFETYICTF